METPQTADTQITAGDLHTNHVGHTITLDATVCGNHTHLTGTLTYIAAAPRDGGWITMWIGESTIPVSVPFTHPVTITTTPDPDGWEVAQWRRDHTNGSRYLGSSTVTWLGGEWSAQLHVRFEPVTNLGQFETARQAIDVCDVAASLAFNPAPAEAGAR